jgi:hypothetical protein
MIAFFANAPPVSGCARGLRPSHYWGRTLRALGHEVRLIPAAYVKPFVKRNKTDARDAAAICLAARRPDMRPVAVKSEAQQASRALKRSRELLVRQPTQLMNSLRAMLAEFGVVAAQGLRGFTELRERLADGEGLPETRGRRAAPLGRPARQPDAGDRGARGPDQSGRQGRSDDAAVVRRPRRRLSDRPRGRGRDFAAWAGMTKFLLDPTDGLGWPASVMRRRVDRRL